MEIIDMNGKAIEITDLETAIEFAEAYKDYHHTTVEGSAMDKRLHEYWSDIYIKLLQLKSEDDNPKV